MVGNLQHRLINDALRTMLRNNAVTDVATICCLELYEVADLFASRRFYGRVNFALEAISNELTVRVYKKNFVIIQKII